MSISFLRKLFGDDDSVKKASEQIAPEEVEDNHDGGGALEAIEAEENEAGDSEDGSEYADRKSVV